MSRVPLQGDELIWTRPDPAEPKAAYFLHVTASGRCRILLDNPSHDERTVEQRFLSNADGEPLVIPESEWPVAFALSRQELHDVAEVLVVHGPDLPGSKVLIEKAQS